MRLRGKIAAITGAGAGIGKTAAQLFASEGATVVILEINETKGQAVQSDIESRGGKALFIRTDMAEVESVKAAFEQMAAQFGRLDVLYNNAAIFLGKHDARVTDLSLETWHRILSINLNGLFYASKYGLPLMIRSGGGSVIHTSSSAGVIGIPNCDAYTVTKGAAVALTRSMAVEYGPDKIRVNCIAPAAIFTDMIRESNLDDPTFDQEKFLKSTPVRRWGLPEDVAQVALFLASDDASYINGAILPVDGGITIT